MVLNQNGIRIFLSFWKKEWLRAVPVKGNFVDNGPSLVAESLFQNSLVFAEIQWYW